MAVKLARTFEGDRLVVRDESAVNEYNRDGISLSAVDEEILWARYLPQIDISVLIKRYPELLGHRSKVNEDIHKLTREALAGGPAFLPSCRSGSSRTWRQHSPNPLWANLHPPTARTSAKSVFEAQNVADHELAEEIAKCPLLLLVSPTHASSLVQWFYQRIAPRDKDEKELAARLIKVASGGDRPPHREKLFRYDTPTLRQAESDLRAYRDLLRSCMETEKSLEPVTQYFPDCNEFAEIFDDSECRPLKHIARDGGTNLPGAEKFATAFLADRIGCGRSTVATLLK